MIKNKIFIITIDTEGDNQWDTSKGISTENAKYLPRFQELCEKYGFKPVWLTNYEMAMEPSFVEYMKKKQELGLCEIGMHLHAWNNPPEYQLNRINDQRDYLIEYPIEIMEQKIKVLTELLTSKFGKRPISHRSGRWAMDDRYFSLLEKYGYRVDCSVTPFVDWSGLKGSTGVEGTNYSTTPYKPHYIGDRILEVPVTIRKIHCLEFNRIKNMHSFLGEVKRFVIGRHQWLRPDKFLSKRGIKKLLRKIEKEQELLMFMIHSSELMPGGSHNFVHKQEIERLYTLIEEIFKEVKSTGYQGQTLREYVENYEER